MISVDEYDRLEADARSGLANAMQQAFTPATFMMQGDPICVGREAELVRFVDSMHEYSAADYFKRFYPLTHDEADLLTHLGDHIVKYCADHFGRPLRPWVAPLSALEMFRAASALAKRLGKERITVLEIGCGSGYFGALMHLAGHRHISMDVTQAYYLWQNRLFSSLAGERFREFADPNMRLSDDPECDFLHIPWFRFCRLHEDNPFCADMVVVDHALNEMNDRALRYVLHRSREMLERVDGGVFTFCHFGMMKMRNHLDLFGQFYDAGYEAVFKRLFYAFQPRGGRLSSLANSREEMCEPSPWNRAKIKLRRRQLRTRHPDLLALDETIPAYDPSGRGGMLAPADVIPIRRSEMPPDYSFAAATGCFIPPWSAEQ